VIIFYTLCNHKRNNDFCQQFIKYSRTRPDRFHERFLKLPGEDIYFQAASFLMDHDETLWAGGTDEGLFILIRISII